MVIRSEFGGSVDTSQDPHGIADFLLTKHAKRTDDAHVLVARFLGT